MRCYWRLLNVLDVKHEEVRRRIQDAIGVHDDITAYHSHISRSSGMAKTILHGTVKETKVGKYEDNRQDGFGDSLRAAEDMERWVVFSKLTSAMVSRRGMRLEL